MINKTFVKSCCGSNTLIFNLEKPLRKFQVKPLFTDCGWSIPNNFFEAGILYASKKSVIINGSFGGTRFNVRGIDQSVISELESLLEKAILIK